MLRWETEKEKAVVDGIEGMLTIYIELDAGSDRTLCSFRIERGWFDPDDEETDFKTLTAKECVDALGEDKIVECMRLAWKTFEPKKEDIELMLQVDAIRRKA